MNIHSNIQLTYTIHTNHPPFTLAYSSYIHVLRLIIGFKIDEKVLDLYLKAATGPGAKKKLEGMLSDPAVDIRYYAERALTRFS